MATVTQPTAQRLVMYNVDWATYTRLLRVFAERPSFRLAYDRGVLEIMSPLFEHEAETELLARFVQVLTEELGRTILSGGSTALRRRRRRRGIEPDKCWWIAHEPQLRGRLHINLRVDPPPDLAIETDVTRSSLNRMGLYAALGIPEVWRLDNRVLTFQLLGPSGQYAEAPQSLSFPMVSPADLMSFLGLRSPQMDENAIVAQLRAWIRQRIAPGGTP
jgi:Uma2 family endonuclease